jgi:hypothetical protein
MMDGDILPSFGFFESAAMQDANCLPYPCLFMVAGRWKEIKNERAEGDSD